MVSHTPAPGSRSRAVSPRTWLAATLALLSAIAFGVLVSLLPIEIFGDAAFDDAWYWQRAASIVDGRWLGDYDRMTLAKGAGYPLLLAAVHLLGLSLTTAQALLYAGACLLLGAAVQRLGGRTWLSLLVVLVVLWHPAALSWSRVLRDGIGAAQALWLLAGLLHLLCALRDGRRGWGWAVLAGSALGWMWLTREDGIWVFPGIAWLLLVPAWQWRRDRPRLARLAIAVALLAAVFAASLAAVAAMNRAAYGVSVTVETRDSAYADALAALQSVRVGDPVAFVPVPQRVREAVYAVSPAFARLRPHLEGDVRHWTQAGCEEQLHDCNDYAGGWFMWALRDAVAATGAYASAPAADAFYREVADDIGSACADRRLACRRSASGLMPAVTAAQWRTLPERTARAIRLLLWQGRRDGWGGSHLAAPGTPPMWRFVGRPRLHEPAGGLRDPATAASTGDADAIPTSAEAPAGAWRVRVAISRAYAVGLPWLVAAGLLAFGWASIRALRLRALPPLLLVAAAAWALAGARMMLVVLVDLSAFIAIRVHYLQPAYPLLVLAALLSLAVALAGARTRHPAESVAPVADAG